MNESLATMLEVNRASIELNRFAGEFLARTVIGAVSSLKGAEDIRQLQLLLEHGDISIAVNGNEVPLTPFPEEIIINTITGLISSLKGVDKIDSLKIDVKTK
jgi:hypothetical protein